MRSAYSMHMLLATTACLLLSCTSVSGLDDNGVSVAVELEVESQLENLVGDAESLLTDTGTVDVGDVQCGRWQSQTTISTVKQAPRSSACELLCMDTKGCDEVTYNTKTKECDMKVLVEAGPENASTKHMCKPYQCGNIVEKTGIRGGDHFKIDQADLPVGGKKGTELCVEQCKLYKNCNAIIFGNKSKGGWCKIMNVRGTRYRFWNSSNLSHVRICSEDRCGAWMEQSSFAGKHIATSSNVQTDADCRKKCSHTQRCTGASYDRYAKKCEMFEVQADAVPMTAASKKAMKMCRSDICGKWMNGYDFVGAGTTNIPGVATGFKTDTKEQCAAKCASTPGCETASWIWDASKVNPRFAKTCWLKKVAPTVVPTLHAHVVAMRLCPNNKQAW